MAVRRAVAVWAAALVVSCGLIALPLVAYAATFSVDIQGFAYSPTPITIRVGDTVTWTNRDSAQHSARFTGMGTPILSQGQRGSLTFTTAGTFNYDCAVHGSAMQGTVIVQAVTTPQPTPPPTAPPTAAPTSVRTAPPTAPPTTARTETPPTATPTESPTPQATTPAPSATSSPVAAPSETPTASPTTAAAQLTPAPTAGGGGIGPLLIGAAALAVVALGAIALFLVRRP
jgi:plastocyanin